MDRDLTLRRVLQVGGNQHTSLPAEIGQLRQLEQLSVRDSNWLDRDLTQVRAPGLQQSAQMVAARAGPVAEAQEALGATLGPADCFLTCPPLCSFSETHFQ